MLGRRQIVKWVIQEPDIVAIQILTQKRRDPVELRCHEACAPIKRRYAEPGHVRRVIDDISRLRIGVERDVGNVATPEMRRKRERQHSVQNPILVRLAALRARQVDLVGRNRINDAHAAATADRKGAAGIGSEALNAAKSIEVVPSPNAFMGDIHIVIRRGACRIEAILLKAGERRAARRGHCRIARRIVNAERQAAGILRTGKRTGRETRPIMIDVVGATVAGRRKCRLPLNRRTNQKFMECLGDAHGFTRNRVGHRGIFLVLVPLPETPTDRQGLRRIRLDRGSEHIDEGLVGVRSLIHDDLRSRSDSTRLLDIESGLHRTGRVARCTRAAIDIDDAQAVVFDRQTERAPIAEGIARRQGRERENAEGPALPRNALGVQRFYIV